MRTQAPPRAASVEKRALAAGAGLGIAKHTCTVFTCDIVLACYGSPEVPFAEVEDRLRSLDRRFTRFRTDSEISALNSQAGTWCDISPRMYALLSHALDVAVASDGLVNIAVLPWLLAAGYVTSDLEAAPDNPPRQPTGRVPPLTSILELHRRQARVLSGHALDVGGVAKGIWADEVVAWLGPNSAASLGGDVSCRGLGASGQGWPVALPGGEVIVITDGGIATSGVTKRRWGDGMHHLIDPRTGRPSCSDIAEATVVATTGAAAEWASTALVVGGTAAAEGLAKRSQVRGWRLSTTREPDVGD